MPQDSFLNLELNGEAAAWTLGDRLLAYCANVLLAANYQRAGKRMPRAEVIEPPKMAPRMPETRTEPRRRVQRAVTPSPEPAGTWQDLDKLFTGGGED